MICSWCSKSFFSLLKSLGALYTQQMIQEPRVTFTVFLYHLVRQENELFQDVDSWKKQIYVIVWLDTTLVWRLFYIIPSNEHNFSQATLDDPRKLCTCTMKVFRLLFHCTPSFRPTFGLVESDDDTLKKDDPALLKKLEDTDRGNCVCVLKLMWDHSSSSLLLIFRFICTSTLEYYLL